MHTDQYVLFDSHHQLKHKQGVIRTLNHQAEVMPRKTEGKEQEQKHIKGTLKTCGYPNWTFAKRSWADREEVKRNHNNIINPYVAGISEKLRRIFNKHHILVHFKPTNTLRQKPVHPHFYTTIFLASLRTTGIYLFIKKTHTKKALFNIRQKRQGLKHPFGPYVCTRLFLTALWGHSHTEFESLQLPSS